ncbi:MAG: CvpA family protein [Verrucomicrobiota bacterium]
MILLDLLIVAYIAYGVWRGRKRGIIIEAPGTVSLAIFFFSGWGLLKALYRGLAYSSELVGNSVGLVTFIGLVVAAIVLWKKIKIRIAKHAERWCPEAQRSRAGAIAGGVKAFLLVSTLLLILAHGPLRSVTRWIAEGSLLGQGLIHFVLPVYEQTHGTL